MNAAAPSNKLKRIKVKVKVKVKAKAGANNLWEQIATNMITRINFLSED
jgi:hypothetical protein